MSYKIAIDGPSSAGKSTVAKALSKELGYVYIDTGAIYRTLALYLIQNGIDYDNEDEIKKVLDKINVDIEYLDGVQQLILNGENVTKYIRTPEVSDAASKSSRFPSVREKLLNLQRSLADKNNCVMDGRDIGSKVLPDANLKIFLTADIDCRSKRRYEENIAKGINCTLEDTKKEMEERDYRDSHREVDPLVQVEDAILIDSTNLSIDEVIDKILELSTGGIK